MNFQDGDKVLGTYGGNTWIREGGRWYLNGNTKVWYSDEVMEWAILLQVETPKASKPTGPVKISKSDPVSTPTYQYNYTYKPKEQ